ncbi:hypothetical protein [Accumulibacter sp.]|uniref:hypothetical protein n=1 Tax=Accumulibacter sp. TaxID=2053492 RepID=UPI0028C43990|nr:hypothetical protein [Accumulibacter sp.]
MNTELNNDQIKMIVERARNERGIAAGRLIATTIHRLLDRMEKGSKNAPQAPAVLPSGYHLSSEGSRPNAFDTSAFG